MHVTIFCVAFQLFYLVTALDPQRFCLVYSIIYTIHTYAYVYALLYPISSDTLRCYTFRLQ